MDQFDPKVDYRIGRNPRSTPPFTVGELGWDFQVNHASRANILQPFDPSRDHIFKDEKGAHSHGICFIKDLSIIERTAVMNSYQALRDRMRTSAATQDLVSQPGFAQRKLGRCIGVNDIRAWPVISPATAQRNQHEDPGEYEQARIAEFERLLPATPPWKL